MLQSKISKINEAVGQTKGIVFDTDASQKILEKFKTKILSTKQIADLFEVDEKSVNSQIVRKKLKGIQLRAGRKTKFFVHIESLEEYLRDGRTFSIT